MKPNFLATVLLTVSSTTREFRISEESKYNSPIVQCTTVQVQTLCIVEYSCGVYP